jgi:uncharacterized membrane protein
MQMTDAVDIDAPAGVVWERYTDVERWPDWTASIRSVERLDEGPLRVGTRVRISQPRLPTVVWEVTELTEGRSWTWTARSPGAVTHASHRVEDQGDGTHVEQAIEQTGPLGALVGLLYRRLTRRYLALEGEGLKRVCEVGVAGPSGAAGE